MLNKILNLTNVNIKKYSKIENDSCVFQIESASKNAICPRCGSRSKNLHQNHWYLVKDLPICGQNNYLKVNRRQWKCQQCKQPFSEELEWINKRRRYTKRLAEYILKQLANSNIKIVSEMNDVTVAEIERMLKDAKEKVNKK